MKAIEIELKIAELVKAESKVKVSNLLYQFLELWKEMNFQLGGCGLGESINSPDDEEIAKAEQLFQEMEPIAYEVEMLSSISLMKYEPLFSGGSKIIADYYELKKYIEGIY